MAWPFMATPRGAQKLTIAINKVGDRLLKKEGGDMSKIEKAVLLGLAIPLFTPLSAMLACSNTIDTPTWSQRCPTGRWCDSEECASCPGCGTDCFCDCNVLCPCFPGWLNVCSCWFNNCGGGGTADAPASQPQDRAVSAKRPMAVSRYDDRRLVSRKAGTEGRVNSCARGSW